MFITFIKQSLLVSASGELIIIRSLSVIFPCLVGLSGLFILVGLIEFTCWFLLPSPVFGQTLLMASLVEEYYQSHRFSHIQ